MRVAILDDDAVQADIIRRVCESIGHSTAGAASAALFKSMLSRDTFDLLILDWMLPEGSGLEVIQWVKANIKPSPPILMVTGRTEDEDLVQGLQAGADDYVTKPIAEPILSARVQALLRRSYAKGRGEALETHGGYSFDAIANVARFRGEEAALTDKEIALAMLLFRNFERALSRDYILDQIPGWNPDLASRTLDIHVSKLRTKLKLRPSEGFRLSSIYGFGYRLEGVAPAERQQKDD